MLGFLTKTYIHLFPFQERNYEEQVTPNGSFIAQILESKVKNLSLMFRNILNGLVEFAENLHYQLAIICVSLRSDFVVDF